MLFDDKTQEHNIKEQIFNDKQFHNLFKIYKKSNTKNT